MISIDNQCEPSLGVLPKNKRDIFLLQLRDIGLNYLLPPSLKAFGRLGYIDGPTLLPDLGEQACTLTLVTCRRHEGILQPEKTVIESDIFTKVVKRLEEF